MYRALAPVVAVLLTLLACGPRPEDVEMRASLAAATGAYAEAEALYCSLRGEPGVDEEALACNLASLAHAQGRCAEAEAALLDLRAAGYGDACTALAVCLRERGREEDALSCALEGPPGWLRDSEVADLLSMTGRSGAATVAYGRMVGADPLTQFNLVSSLADEGYDVSDGAYAVLCRVDPSDALELVASCVRDPTDYLVLSSWWRSAHESEAASWR